MRRLLAIPVALILLIACQPGHSDMTDAEKAAISDSMNVVLQGFWDAWAETDFDSAMRYFLESPEIVFSWGAGRMIVGYAAADSNWRPMFSVVERQDISIDETHVSVLSRDAVSASQRGSYAAYFRNGDTAPPMSFSFTTVWVRTEEGWKVIAGHQSDTDAASP